MKSAASYARISEKVERDKVADQHRQNEAHAAARGYLIVAQFTDDGISALGHKVRPDFQRMLLAAERGEFEVIIATEEERLARNVGEKLELHEACSAVGVVWDTIRDGYVDPATDSGEFMSTVRAAMGRIESKRKARRQLAANAARVNDGLPVPGKTRFGYKRGNIELEAAQAARVQWLFTRFLAGDCVRALANQMGWRTLRVRETLANPAYAGWVVRHGERFEAHKSVGRVIDRATFEAVEALLRAPGRKTSPGPAPKHPLSGIARCGICGNPMTYRNNYICAQNLSHPCIKKEILEAHVREEVLLALMFSARSNPPETSRLASIDRRQIEIQEARAELVASIEYGARAADVGPSIQRLEAEDGVLSIERDQIISASVSLSMLSDLRAKIFDYETRRASFEGVAAAKKELLRRYDGLDLQQRRDLIRGSVSVVIYPGRGAQRVVVRSLWDAVEETD